MRGGRGGGGTEGGGGADKELFLAAGFPGGDGCAVEEDLDGFTYLELLAHLLAYSSLSLSLSTLRVPFDSRSEGRGINDVGPTYQ